jgi:DNA-binding IclR family transcriptional regulator
MSILGAFSRERPVLGLVDISRRTGLAASTIHRLVAELTEWGALARTPDLRYRIGPMLLRLGAIGPRGFHSTSDLGLDAVGVADVE